MGKVFAGISTFLVLLLVLPLSPAENVSYHEQSAPTRYSVHNTRIPLYFLLLLPIPNGREDVGWDLGPSVLAGARAAQNEVNEKTGFLDGYQLELIESHHEACGIRRTSQGVVNFLDNAVNPGSGHSQPVVAVGGLMCSDSTNAVSSLAGRPEVAILQLSGANSLIFDRPNATHPYLWRFLASASILKDVVISLMDEYEWTNVFLVYDGGNGYFTGIANEFKNAISARKTKQIVAEDIVLFKEDIYYEQLVKDIKASRTKVIVAFVSQYQIAKLACIAKREGLTYPNYQWVFTNDSTSLSLTDVDCPERDSVMGIQHALFVNFRIFQEPSIRLFSGVTYKEYTKKYKAELEKIESENNVKYVYDPFYGGILYDQVWALSIALNSTIPFLKQQNISIEDYAFGQPFVTDILHEGMSNVSFIGASTNVSFIDKQVVFNKIDIYHVNETGIDFIATHDGTTLTLQVDLTGEAVNDYWDPLPSILPPSVTALLLTADALVVIFITVVLILFAVLHNKPEVKATSPLLSCLLFIGCYMLCISAFCSIANIGFILEEVLFTTFCNLLYILLINGFLLIFITLLIRLLRVHRIFNNKHLSTMHERLWSTWFLSIVVFALCAIPNIALVVRLSVNPLKYNSTVVLSLDARGMLTANNMITCIGENNKIWNGLFLALAAVLTAGILFLSFRTRKVPYKNFKDTKKVNLFLALLIVVSSLSVTLGFILQSTDVYFAAMEISMIVGLMLLLPVLCQLLLFIPKITPSQWSLAVLRTISTCEILKYATFI